MKQRVLPILLSLALCLTLLPGAAWAAEGDVTYLYYDYENGEWKTGTVDEYTVLTSPASLKEGW